jgi:hypothetical protein
MQGHCGERFGGSAIVECDERVCESVKGDELREILPNVLLKRLKTD